MTARHEVRGLVAAATATGLVSVAIGWILGAATLPSESIFYWIVAIAVLCLAMAAYAVAIEKDPLSPLVIFSVVFALLYIGRPLYILGSGVTGAGRVSQSQSLTPGLVAAMGAAAGLAALAILSFVAGYAFVRWHSSASSNHRSGIASGSVRRLADRVPAPRSWFTASLVALSALSLGVSVSLVQSAGGFSAYIDGLSVRSEFFAGRSFLTLAPLPIKLAAFVTLGLILRFGSRTVAPVRLAGMGVAVVIVGDFLTGGRAPLLLGTMVPLLLIFHYLRRPVRGKTILALSMIALLLFIGIRVVTRDAVFQSVSGGPQRTTAVIFKDTLLDLPQTVFGSNDAVPFDSMVTLTEAARRGAPLLWGETYISVFTYPVPRALWPEKPAGGNTWFTKEYYPLFYGREQVETSVSGAGELYANFGPVGIALGFLALGAIASFAHGLARSSRTPLIVVLYSVGIGYLVTFVRGDAFHSVTTLAVSVTMLMMVSVVLTRARRS